MRVRTDSEAFSAEMIKYVWLTCWWLWTSVIRMSENPEVVASGWRCRGLRDRDDWCPWWSLLPYFGSQSRSDPATTMPWLLRSLVYGQTLHNWHSTSCNLKLLLSPIGCQKYQFFRRVAGQIVGIYLLRSALTNMAGNKKQKNEEEKSKVWRLARRRSRIYDKTKGFQVEGWQPFAVATWNTTRSLTVERRTLQLREILRLLWRLSTDGTLAQPEQISITSSKQLIVSK